ncbi:UNVERIFIED_CONTAM: hypothetical protein K2H54_058820 [Gekko kuhli]
MGKESSDKAAPSLPVEKTIQSYFNKINRTPASEDAGEEDPNKMAAEEHVAQTAEQAKELGVTLKDEVGTIANEMSGVKSRVLNLEVAGRRSNLKFRGFPDPLNIGTDLQIFVAEWLGRELKLEENVVPIVTAAYCLGLQTHPTRRGPRDLLAVIPDARARKKNSRRGKNQGLVYISRQQDLRLPGPAPRRPPEVARLAPYNRNAVPSQDHIQVDKPY